MPLFGALTVAANPALAEAQQHVLTTLAADPAGVPGSSISSARTPREASGCDLAKRQLAERGARYTRATAAARCW